MLARVLEDEFGGVPEGESPGEAAARILVQQKLRLSEGVPLVGVVPCAECAAYHRGYCHNREAFASVRRGYRVPEGHGCPAGVRRET